MICAMGLTLINGLALTSLKTRPLNRGLFFPGCLIQVKETVMTDDQRFATITADAHARYTGLVKLFLVNGILHHNKFYKAHDNPLCLPVVYRNQFKVPAKSLPSATLEWDHQKKKWVLMDERLPMKYSEHDFYIDALQTYEAREFLS